MRFGERLQQLRKAKGMTQVEFAEAAGLSASGIRGIEQGWRLPSWPNIVRIARTLGVTVDSFNDCDEVAEERVEPEKPKRKAKK